MSNNKVKDVFAYIHVLRVLRMLCVCCVPCVRLRVLASAAGPA